MAILILTSAGGSPGVTTLAVGLALTWPRPVLLADCDPGAHQADPGRLPDRPVQPRQGPAPRRRGPSGPPAAARGGHRPVPAPDRRGRRPPAVPARLHQTRQRRPLRRGLGGPGRHLRPAGRRGPRRDHRRRPGRSRRPAGPAGRAQRTHRAGARLEPPRGDERPGPPADRSPTTRGCPRPLATSSVWSWSARVVRTPPARSARRSASRWWPRSPLTRRPPPTCPTVPTRPRRFDSSALVRSIRGAANALATTLQRSTELVRS